MMKMNCPKCDANLEFEPADPSVGIMCGGWYCSDCDMFTSEHEVDDEPMPDNVVITPSDSSRPMGTPISELSGRPGHPGHAEFLRIAKSWGYD